MRKVISGALAALLILLGTAKNLAPDYLPERPRPQLVSRGEPVREYLGVMDVTAFTAGPESTGKRPGDKGYRRTKSGTWVTEGRTCAAPASIPFGAVLYIEDVGERIVEDRGPQHIDLYMEDIDWAEAWGR